MAVLPNPSRLRPARLCRSLCDFARHQKEPSAPRNAVPRLAFYALTFYTLTLCSASAAELPATAWSTITAPISDSSPAVAMDGTVYVGSFDGKLWALNPDGSAKWTFRAGLEIKSSPAVAAGGSVYFGSRDRKLYALNPNGAEKWHFKIGGWIDSSPAIASDGAICFGGWDQKFYCLNPNGTPNWSFQTAGVIDSSPAIGLDGTIYFGSHDQDFYALTPDGKLKWKFRTGAPITSSPAVDSNKSICFTSLDGFCYSFNQDGSLRWKLRTGGITSGSPVIGSDGAVFVTVNDMLWHIRPTGEKEREYGLEGPANSTPLLLSDQSLCVMSGWGNVMKYGFHPADFQWYMNVYVQCTGSPGISAQGTIYVPRLIALGPKIPIAASPWPKFRGNSRNTGNASDNAGTAGK
jgi:hypothetical protein